MGTQHTEETSFWLQGLTRLLDTVPEEWRQQTFDTCVSGKDTKKYQDELRRIADRYGINFGTKASQVQINVAPWTEDVELSDLEGSVLFDIFYRGKLEELPGYKEFKRQIKSQGSEVSYFPGKGIIRVHNNDSEVPIQVLGRAHKWAHEKELSHAYIANQVKNLDIIPCFAICDQLV